jgi:hypothetical protein
MSHLCRASDPAVLGSPSALAHLSRVFNDCDDLISSVIVSHGLTLRSDLVSFGPLFCVERLSQHHAMTGLLKLGIGACLVVVIRQVRAASSLGLRILTRARSALSREFVATLVPEPGLGSWIKYVFLPHFLPACLLTQLY